MKISYCLLSALVLGFSVGATAQITGLLINGSSTNFTMTSGDTIRWGYNINPVGATVTIQIWYDVNQNGVIDPSTDKIFGAFTQTDGDTLGNNGPSDMDGLRNGKVFFRQHVGLAPGKYIFKISYNSDVHTLTGTVNALVASHTVSGTVTPPPGKSARYVFVQADRNGNYEPNFWDAVTDASGNFTIAMSADTAGNPWTIRFTDGYNPFPPSIPTPSEISLTISGPSYTGQNFSFQAASAQVAGYIRDESGNPLLGTGVFAYRNDGLVYRNARTNGSGFYQIGFLAAELDSQSWHVQIEGNGGNSTYLVGQKTIPVINMNDSIPVNLVVYTANSQISGTITFQGFPPGFPLQVFAENADSAQASTFSDGLTGAFTLPVSYKIYNYDVFVANLPSNFNAPTIHAHPGDSGINIDITITSVRERAPGVPNQFLLGQNYPNPFNPVTSIGYDIASASRVRLVVFDILGREVARLVDQEQPAGKYTATFDGSRLSSGLYFYRLQAGTYTRTMKLVLMK